MFSLEWRPITQTKSVWKSTLACSNLILLLFIYLFECCVCVPLLRIPFSKQNCFTTNIWNNNKGKMKKNKNHNNNHRHNNKMIMTKQFSMFTCISFSLPRGHQLCSRCYLSRITNWLGFNHLNVCFKNKLWWNPKIHGHSNLNSLCQIVEGSILSYSLRYIF